MFDTQEQRRICTAETVEDAQCIAAALNHLPELEEELAEEVKFHEATAEQRDALDLEVQRLTKAHARVVEALEFYAEQGRLCRMIHREGEEARRALDKDGVEKARAALAAVKGETP